MMLSILIWGSVIGIVHFIFTGIVYGSPAVARIYRAAEKAEPGVRQWSTRKAYIVRQFLGTQVEVFILTACFFWLRPLIPASGVAGAALLGLALAAVRVYPRFWNMWIQSTYPNRLLKVEAVVGTLGTLLVICGLQVIA